MKNFILVLILCFFNGCVHLYSNKRDLMNDGMFSGYRGKMIPLRESIAVFKHENVFTPGDVTYLIIEKSRVSNRFPYVIAYNGSIKVRDEGSYEMIYDYCFDLPKGTLVELIAVQVFYEKGLMFPLSINGSVVRGAISFQLPEDGNQKIAYYDYSQRTENWWPCIGPDTCFKIRKKICRGPWEDESVPEVRCID